MDEQLTRLAGHNGVAVEYWDQGGSHHEVAPETVIAVLAGLGVAATTDAEVAASLRDSELSNWRRVLPPVFVHRRSRTGRIWVHVPHGTPLRCHLVWEDGSGAIPAEQVEHLVAPTDVDGVLIGEAAFEIPADLPIGYHQFQARTPDGAVHVCPLVVTPDRLEPAPSGWGLMVQLYAAASRQSWGVGDLGDLATLVQATADAEGQFVLVNPMHAASPVDPMEPSPYLPVSRRFANPVYLDLAPLIADAQLSASDRERVVAIHDELMRLTNGADTLDWAATWRAKREVLEILYASASFANGEFAGYVHEQGVALQDFALWCAIADELGPRWQEWPADLQSVRSGGVTLQKVR